MAKLFLMREHNKFIHLGMLYLYLSGCQSALPRAQNPVSAKPSADQARPSPQRVSAEAVTDIDIRIVLPTPSPLASASPAATPMPNLSPSQARPQQTPEPTPLPSPTPEPSLAPPTVTSLKITQPDKQALTTGETLQLSAVQTLSDGNNSASWHWVSSQPEIATIDSQGLVKTHAAGSVEIKLLSDLDKSRQDKLTLQISNPLVLFPGKIVYLADNDLYLLDGSNQNPERLTFDGEDRPKRFPRLSWDGTQIVYGSRQTIYTLKLEKPYQAVPYELPVNDLMPAPYFMHDNSLIFSAQGTPGFSTYGRLWLIAPDGTRSVLPLPSAGLGGVTPDGKVVLETSAEVVISPMTGLEQAVYLGGGHDPKIAHHPSPSLIVYNYKENIRLVTFSGQKTTPAGMPYYEGQGTLSPDESKIACVTRRDGNDDLYLMQTDGSNLTRLTFTPEIAESWPEWSQ